MFTLCKWSFLNCKCRSIEPPNRAKQLSGMAGVPRVRLPTLMTRPLGSHPRNGWDFPSNPLWSHHVWRRNMIFLVNAGECWGKHDAFMLQDDKFNDPMTKSHQWATRHSNAVSRQPNEAQTVYLWLRHEDLDRDHTNNSIHKIWTSVFKEQVRFASKISYVQTSSFVWEVGIVGACTISGHLFNI